VALVFIREPTLVPFRHMPGSVADAALIARVPGWREPGFLAARFTSRRR
jgi:hypothetical protein